MEYDILSLETLESNKIIHGLCINCWKYRHYYYVLLQMQLLLMQFSLQIGFIVSGFCAKNVLQNCRSWKLGPQLMVPLEGVTRFALLYLCTMMICLAQKIWTQLMMGRQLWKHDPNQRLLPVAYLLRYFVTMAKIKHRQQSPVQREFRATSTEIPKFSLFFS